MPPASASVNPPAPSRSARTASSTVAGATSENDIGGVPTSTAGQIVCRYGFVASAFLSVGGGWSGPTMPFELTLRYTTPLTPISDVEEVLQEFLRMVGYLPEGEDHRGGDGPVRQTLAYRLVRECLLRGSGAAWYAEELVAVLQTSKPTIYRHINRLKSLDMLEEVGGPSNGKGRKGYRLRYGNLSRAWDHTEANAQNALRRYRETVNHLQTLLEHAPAPAPPGGERGVGAAPAKAAPKPRGSSR